MGCCWANIISRNSPLNYTLRGKSKTLVLPVCLNLRIKSLECHKCFTSSLLLSTSFSLSPSLNLSFVTHSSYCPYHLSLTLNLPLPPHPISIYFLQYHFLIRLSFPTLPYTSLASYSSSCLPSSPIIWYPSTTTTSTSHSLIYTQPSGPHLPLNLFTVSVVIMFT